MILALTSLALAAQTSQPLPTDDPSVSLNINLSAGESFNCTVSGATDQILAGSNDVFALGSGVEWFQPGVDGEDFQTEVFGGGTEWHVALDLRFQCDTAPGGASTVDIQATDTAVTGVAVAFANNRHDVPPDNGYDGLIAGPTTIHTAVADPGDDLFNGTGHLAQFIYQIQNSVSKSDVASMNMQVTFVAL